MSAFQEPLAQEIPPVSGIRSVRSRRWARLLLTFLTGQTLFQGIGLVSGFLLVRWMSVEAYAQYSVALAFQMTLNQLVDVGLSTCIVALVGQRGHQADVIGSYTRCARTYRGRIFFILGGASCVLFPLVTSTQPWPWAIKLSLLAAVLASVFFSAWDVYRAPLLIHQRIAASYRADVAPAAARLALIGVLHAAGILFGWVAAWFSAAVNVATGLMLRKDSADIIAEPENHDPKVAREMVRYLAPLWPGLIYNAFQGQIAVTIISIFGTTRNIAEVSALGRLSQIFALLSAFNITLVFPRIAASPDSQLFKRYFGVLSLTVAFVAVFTSFVMLFPGPFVWLLGSSYRGLRPLIGWSLLAAGINYVAGTAFGMNVARRWTFWSTSVASQVLMICGQILFVWLHGVSTTQDMVSYVIVTACASLAGIMLTTFLGFYRQHRGLVGVGGT